MNATKLLNTAICLNQKKIPVIPGMMSRLLRYLCGCDFPLNVKINGKIRLAHNGLGIVVHPNAVFGDNCKIYQNVTVGKRDNEPGRGENNAPVFGNNVIIYAGACVLGKITIGDNVIIGANAVVMCDVPDNSIAVGVPAVVKRTSH